MNPWEKGENGKRCRLYYICNGDKATTDLLSIFRKNHLFTSLLLFPFALVMRHIGFLFEIPFPDPTGGVLYYPLINADWNTWYWQLGTAFLVFIHAVFINRLCVINRLGTEISLIPGLIYISLASMLPSFMYLSPALLSVTFILAGLTQLFYTYKRYEVSSKIFNAGFWFGIAALCYPSLIMYFILGFIGLIILRSFKWKERLRYMTGFILPFFLTAVLYFWFAEFSIFVEIQFIEGLGYFSFNPESHYPFVVVTTAILVLCLLILNYNAYTSRKNIKTRKKIDIFFWTLLIGGLSVLIQENAGLTHLLLLLPAMSYLFSEHLLLIKSPSLSEFLHLLIILITFFSQYSLFLL